MENRGKEVEKESKETGVETLQLPKKRDIAKRAYSSAREKERKRRQKNEPTKEYKLLLGGAIRSSEF